MHGLLLATQSRLVRSSSTPQVIISATPTYGLCILHSENLSNNNLYSSGQVSTQPTCAYNKKSTIDELHTPQNIHAQNIKQYGVVLTKHISYQFPIALHVQIPTWTPLNTCITDIHTYIFQIQNDPNCICFISVTLNQSLSLSFALDGLHPP